MFNFCISFSPPATNVYFITSVGHLFLLFVYFFSYPVLEAVPRASMVAQIEAFTRKYIRQDDLSVGLETLHFS